MLPKLWELKILAWTMWEGMLKVTKQQYCHPSAPLLSKEEVHYKRVNVATEYSDKNTNKNIATIRSYGFLKPSSNKVAVGVRNLTSKQVILKAGTIIGKIEAANAIPPMLAPKSEIAETDMKSNPEQLSNEKGLTTIPDLNSSTIPPEKCKLTPEEADLLMSKLDLSGIKDWKPEE